MYVRIDGIQNSFILIQHNDINYCVVVDTGVTEPRKHVLIVISIIKSISTKNNL